LLKRSPATSWPDLWRGLGGANRGLRPGRHSTEQCYQGEIRASGVGPGAYMRATFLALRGRAVTDAASRQELRRRGRLWSEAPEAECALAARPRGESETRWRTRVEDRAAVLEFESGGWNLCMQRSKPRTAHVANLQDRGASIFAAVEITVREKPRKRNHDSCNEKQNSALGIESATSLAG
jgi:hypothetical protein